MIKKPKKHTMSLQDSFFKSFQDSSNKRKAKKEVVQSDSDSAKEEEHRNIVKRNRKKKRIKKNKILKKPSEFTVRHDVKKESVTPSNCPEILSVEDSFNTNNTPELIEAEHNFFSTRNSASNQKDFSHVRPFDYPFVRHMVQEKTEETFDIFNLKDRSSLRAKIEPVTRKYEESYLREPHGNERACLMGLKCEGLNISQAKDRAFILREFLLPSEQNLYETTGKYPNEVRLCLMCKRVEILRAFVNIKADAMGIKKDSILQDYRNIVNIKGEYRLSDCIVSSRNCYEGLIDPIVLHIRSAYKLLEKDGLRYYEQWRMAHPANNQHFLLETPSF